MSIADGGYDFQYPLYVTAKCNNYVLSDIFFPICSCVMMLKPPTMPVISANNEF